MRKLAITAAILFAAWIAFAGAMYWAMLQPPARFGAFMKRVPMPAMLLVPFETLWNRARGGRLAPGELAPDFTLPTVDNQSRVRLSQFRGERPIVLVFGSYT